MSFFPKDSAIQVTPSLEVQISKAVSAQEIQALLHQAAQDQKLIEPDPFDRSGTDWFSMRPVEPVTAAKGLTKTLVVDGQTHIIAGGNEAELISAELQLMRTLFAGNASTTQARRSDGKFVSQSDIEAEAERGANIDPAAAALAPSVTAALEAAGIDVNALREFTAAKRGERIQTSWQQATSAFKENHPDWIGGDANKELFARLLDENNLVDAPDKVAALEAVYNHAVENHLLVENPETTARDNIAKAQTYEELKEAVGYRDPALSSSIWGR